MTYHHFAYNQLTEAITGVTIRIAAGVSVGAEVTKQVTEAVVEVGSIGALSTLATTVAIFAGLVAIISACVNFRINNIRLEMEREELAMERKEHEARMRKLEGHYEGTKKPGERRT